MDALEASRPATDESHNCTVAEAMTDRALDTKSRGDQAGKVQRSSGHGLDVSPSTRSLKIDDAMFQVCRYAMAVAGASNLLEAHVYRTEAVHPSLIVLCSFAQE